MKLLFSILHHLNFILNNLLNLNKLNILDNNANEIIILYLHHLNFILNNFIEFKQTQYNSK